MDKIRDYWDGIVKNINSAESGYDGWLDKYNLELLRADQLILELGCGWGDDTEYLSNLPAQLVSCDFSIEAIKMISDRYESVKTCQFDMTDRFPFEDGSVDIVIADLCLHYFNNQDMRYILGEINRILKSKGELICRINSDKDINYGSGQGTEIEVGLFLKDGISKRFFNEKLIRDCFESINIQAIEEYTSFKYPKPKVVWEFNGTKGR